LRVELEDNGKGIPREQWESIFEPFARGLSFHCGFSYSLAKFSCP
jgi:signal transduction histidine kinase